MKILYTVIYETDDAMEFIDYYSEHPAGTEENKMDAYREILCKRGPQILKEAVVKFIIEAEELNLRIDHDGGIWLRETPEYVER